MGNTDLMKKAAAEAAITYIKPNIIVGVGTGSTVNYFIDALATIKHKIEGTIASSEASAARLRAHGIPVYDLNSVNNVPIYVDGTDEFNSYLSLIKGGGGALTREKIIATVAKQFICIADITKKVPVLGKFPLPIEVIPMARSYVAREMVKLGGDPEYREGFITDNGNIILDVHNFRIETPIQMEKQINNIAGVVTNGIFAIRGADVLLLGNEHGVEILGELR